MGDFQPASSHGTNVEAASLLSLQQRLDAIIELADQVAEQYEIHAHSNLRTHWMTCYRHHTECLAARVLDLATETPDDQS